MAQVFLHIGTPKTGTTAIQHTLSSNDTTLRNNNIAFLKAGRHRSAHNALANSISRQGPDHKFVDELTSELETVVADRQSILLSSEIFALIPAEKFAQAIPQLRDHSVKIIVYLRRHDQYVEAFYKQRLKNGRIKQSFESFLTSKTCRRITDYPALLTDWSEAYPDAEIVPRIYDRAAFKNGDIVDDFWSLLGIETPASTETVVERNLSPSRDVIDILLAISPHFSGPEMRTLYRRVKAQDLEGFSGKGDLFKQSARIAYCEGFAQQNEVLRTKWLSQTQQAFPVVEQQKKSKDAGDHGPVRRALLGALLQAALEIQANRNK